MANRRTPSWPGAPWHLLLTVLAATCIAAGGVSASGPGDDLNVAFNRLPQPTAGVPQRLASRSTASDAAFRFLFVDQFPNTIGTAERFYVNRLMRAAGRLLARSVRVRSRFAQTQPPMYSHHLQAGVVRVSHCHLLA